MIKMMTLASNNIITKLVITPAGHNNSKNSFIVTTITCLYLHVSPSPAGVALTNKKMNYVNSIATL